MYLIGLQFYSNIYINILYFMYQCGCIKQVTVTIDFSNNSLVINLTMYCNRFNWSLLTVWQLIINPSYSCMIFTKNSHSLFIGRICSCHLSQTKYLRKLNWHWHLWKACLSWYPLVNYAQTNTMIGSMLVNGEGLASRRNGR